VARPDARWNELAELYDAKVGDDVADPNTAALLRLVGDVRGLRLLDLACGQGRVSRELARRGSRVVGIDIAVRLLEKARAKEAAEPLGIRYEEIDASEPTALEGEAFDGAACNFGLSDIDDLNAALETVARVLVPDGFFAFSILHPCFPGWPERDAPSSWEPGTGYDDEGWWRATSSGFRGTVGANHRKLSTYLNALTGHGLVLEELSEPRFPTEWVASSPDVDPVPLYLSARYRRA
jgi:2-polyprenyl-3-methyl-5-hydroxy-6-metoxy-1,4-benzoquinol methylase